MTRITRMGTDGTQMSGGGGSHLEREWELEAWLLETGEAIARKLSAQGFSSLSPAEKLAYEVWLLDLETRNGGLSQYVCNHGLVRWEALRESWLPEQVPSLGPFIDEVDRLLLGADDAYLAALQASPGIEAAYESQQLQIKAQLQRLLTAGKVNPYPSA